MKEVSIKVEPKFHEGDWVVRGKTIAQILDIQEQYYVGLDIDGNDFTSSRFLSDDKIHLWDITKDAKDGDVLCSESGWTCIFKALDNHTNTFSSYCFMDKDKWFCNIGSECHTLDKVFIKAYNGEIHPATKEQRDTLLKAMADAGYTFDFEKKELNKIEPKFKVGDFIVNDYCFGKVIALTDDAYLLDTGQGIPFSCEHNAHLWTIEDAKDGDTLVDRYGNIGIFEKLFGNDWHSYCYLGCNGDFMGTNVGGSHDLVDTYPATKEQRDQLEKAMADAGYTFDFEKKELKKIEQNPAWSEEDEMFVHGLIRGLAAKRDIYGHTTFSSDCIDITETINWLKSLKDRYTWKPSDEQMEALEHFIVYHNGSTNYAKDLEELRLQLKKLKG
jgi:hypothetical protein